MQQLKRDSTGEYKEKGSKFLAFAFQVDTLAEVEAQLTSLRATYQDARHHCYAYRLGSHGEIARAQDDGEPRHSAGDPILNQIKSHGLTHTLVVVVRYFGGTKFGVSGLIQAYKTAADEALRKGGTEAVRVLKKGSLSFDYAHTGEVERLLSRYEAQVIHRSFGESCVWDFFINAKDWPTLFSDATHLPITLLALEAPASR